MSFSNSDSSVNVNYNEEDIKGLLRDIKIQFLKGKIKPNLNFLSFKEKDTLCKILNEYNDSLISGSLALKMFGLIDRKIDDVDIALDDNYSYFYNKHVTSNINLDFNKDRIKIYDKKKNHEIDIFKVDENISTIKFNNIKIISPVFILKKKLNYFRAKDEDDYLYMKKLLKSIKSE